MMRYTRSCTLKHHISLLRCIPRGAPFYSPMRDAAALRAPSQSTASGQVTADHELLYGSKGHTTVRFGILLCQSPSQAPNCILQNLAVHRCITSLGSKKGEHATCYTCMLCCSSLDFKVAGGSLGQPGLLAGACPSCKMLHNAWGI